jgi:hypothetical protein
VRQRRKSRFAGAGRTSSPVFSYHVLRDKSFLEICGRICEAGNFSCTIISVRSRLLIPTDDKMPKYVRCELVSYPRSRSRTEQLTHEVKDGGSVYHHSKLSAHNLHNTTVGKYLSGKTLSHRR